MYDANVGDEFGNLPFLYDIAEISFLSIGGPHTKS